MIRAEIKSLILLILIFALCFPCFSCRSKLETDQRLRDGMPPVILWAWERAEDLRFVDTEKFGVAFLAQTLFLQTDEVVFRPRRQPLQIAPETYLIAVTRIETNKQNESRPILSAEQKIKIVSFVKKTLELPSVKAVQVDFDAIVSERNFYRDLIVDLKRELPENTHLTITALASWCVGDAWFADLPIDEAVPMIFEMGADAQKIQDFLLKENDWREPLCRASYGISIDEPLEARFKPDRRSYIFNRRAWRVEDLKRLPEGVEP